MISRASMDDEQWVEWNAVIDGEWYYAVQESLCLDAILEIENNFFN